ncbi:MAG: hypothetical protein Q8P22_06495 [Chloroflexota bacterium]|nr:hypothetical protein [Chloroflexota bacterium]
MLPLRQAPEATPDTSGEADELGGEPALIIAGEYPPPLCRPDISQRRMRLWRMIRLRRTCGWSRQG